MFRRSTLALLALVPLAIVVPGAAAAPPTVADANVDTFLKYSAWARQNDVTAANCRGTGAGISTLGGGKRHATFSCRVEVGFKPGGTVVARALGPEWLKVTGVNGAKLTVDKGIGTIPKGSALMDFSRAGTALENSAWGKGHDVDTAFCLGVGPWRDTGGSWLSSAFSCATLNTFASRGPQVLVVTSGKSAVRIVRTLAK